MEYKKQQVVFSPTHLHNFTFISLSLAAVGGRKIRARCTTWVALNSWTKYFYPGTNWG